MAKKSRQMFQATLKHVIPGRIRLQAQSRAFAQTLGAFCQSLGGVRAVRVNEACAAVIVRFDPGVTDVQALMQALDQGASVRQSHAAQPTAPGCACRLHGQTGVAVVGDLRRFLALSGVMAVFLVRKALFGAVAAQSLVSPLGLAALIAAWPVVRDSLRHARQRRFTLEGFLAAGCVAATVSGQALTALEILWVHSGAETLGTWVSERSRRSISAILDLTAKNTFVLTGGVEVEVPVDSVRVGDVVVLHTGEKVCVDGPVVSGQALVDDSPLTGRSQPALMREGDRVFAGTYVRQGVVGVRAECVGDATYLSRIMRQVEDSLAAKAPIESVADSLARSMVRLGFAATVVTVFFTGSFWRAFTVLLVMACPCATTLSAQTAVSAAIASAARRGILIKGGRYLEDVGRADTICFDKTGTLTAATPRMEELRNFCAMEEDELLRLALSVEMHNHHPLAQAVKREAKGRGLEPVSHGVCDFTLGKGVRAVLGDDQIRLGNAGYLFEAGLDVEAAVGRAADLKERGLTVIYLAKNHEVLAALAFANEPRPDAASTVAELARTGVNRVVLITGDEEKTARDLAPRLGIEETHHSVLPERKGEIVAGLRARGRKVIMVGDGVNDALALAGADIGVAMSAGGADVAIEAADIALVRDDLADILLVRELSRRTLRVAHQNFLLSAVSNLAGALAGALGALSPAAAGALHIAHTLAVLGNSARLLRPLPAPQRETDDTAQAR